MPMSAIKSRIQRAEEHYRGHSVNTLIAEILAREAYYDELTEEEREAYCQYRGTDQETIATLYGYLYGNLHFRVEKKPKPPTKEEHEANIREIHDYILRLEHDKSGIFETN